MSFSWISTIVVFFYWDIEMQFVSHGMMNTLVWTKGSAEMGWSEVEWKGKDWGKHAGDEHFLKLENSMLVLLAEFFPDKLAKE